MGLIESKYYLQIGVGIDCNYHQLDKIDRTLYLNGYLYQPYGITKSNMNEFIILVDEHNSSNIYVDKKFVNLIYTTTEFSYRQIRVKGFFTIFEDGEIQLEQ